MLAVQVLDVPAHAVNFFFACAQNRVRKWRDDPEVHGRVRESERGRARAGRTEQAMACEGEIERGVACVRVCACVYALYT